MKSPRILEKIKVFWVNLGLRIKSSLLNGLINKTERSQKKLGFPVETPQSFAYNLIGNRVIWILPLFKDLDTKLHKSGLKISFKAYVSLTILATALLCMLILPLVTCISYLILDVALLPSVLFGVGVALFTFVFSVVTFYSYPIYRADILKRELEDELPFATGYMAILANAGVSTEKMFASLSNNDAKLAVTVEAKNIVRDVNVFGSDIISALNETSSRTPSHKLSETIEGLIATIRSGGNLAGYLREKSKEYMRLRKIKLKRYSSTLSMLSEVYVTILLTGPLFLVIMLVVMSMLGGGNFGILSPDLMLQLLTYIAIPFGAIAFLVILDMVSPKW